MIRVMIVDDEVMFRIAMHSCIDWKNNGFELVAEASNGREAIEKLRTVPVDVVFTDIKMPEKDGIELSKYINAHYQYIYIVILTCHSELEFARQAMWYGARDYILKLSMTPGSLLEVLDSIRKELKKVRVIRELYTNVATLRNDFFEELVFGVQYRNITAEQYMIKKEALHIAVGFDISQLMLIRVEDYERHLKLFGNARTANAAFLNVCAEVLEDAVPGQLVMPGSGYFVCFPASAEASAESAISAIRRLNALMNKHLDCSISCIIWHGQISAADLGSLIKNTLIDGIDYCYFSSSPFVLYGNTPDTAEINGQLNRYASLIKDLMFYLPSDSDDGITVSGSSAQLTELLKDGRYAQMRKLINKVCGIIFTMLSSKINPLPYEEMTFPQLLSQLAEIKESLQLQAGGRPVFRKEVQAAIDYVRSNLSEHITLKDIASHVYLNERYFCHLFKKETGENFVNYCTRLKIEEAKKLLSTKQFRIEEISLMLGFKSASYFIRTFKKYTNMTPKQY